MFRVIPADAESQAPDHPEPDVPRQQGGLDRSRRVPVYVGVNPIPYLGSAYVGPAFEPFSVYGTPICPVFPSLSWVRGRCRRPT